MSAVDGVDTVSPAPKRRRKQRAASVLYDVPGPRARIRSNITTLVAVLVLALIAYVVFRRMDLKGQWAGHLWTPFLQGDVWRELILPGVWGTLSATVVAAILALIFGVLFGLGRLSDHRVIRWFCGIVVEFFRGIPVLLLIFFILAAPGEVNVAMGRIPVPIPPFVAVVGGLMLYNGAVLAEVFRAGINAVPRGQSEAGYALGLRKGGVMRLILLPQATTAMLPAIVSQLIVLLKDTALGWIVSYGEILNAAFRQVSANYNNTIAAAIVAAVLYIILNLALGAVVVWLERRNRRSAKVTTAQAAVAEQAVLQVELQQGRRETGV